MAQSETPRPPSPADAAEYWLDAWQRGVLFLEVMRRRAAQYEAHAAEVAPNVLDYKAELLLDGRRLERPVNYALVRIVPPEGVEIDPRKRPFVIVDPRAGHGPGIGGFKADSEIGVAMKAGHPAYFIGFLPDPMPGQTIEDIARAEAVFLEAVIARHPEAAVLVLAEGVRIVGYLAVSHRPQIRLGGRIATIDDLSVDPAYTGRGLGSALLEHALELARGLACVRIEVATRRSRESYARGFYRKHGFTEVDAALLRQP